MNEKKLITVSLFFSLIGLLMIIFLSVNLEPPFYKISEINKNLTEKTITTVGKISLIKETKDIFIFTLEDDFSNILVIAFKENDLILEKNTEVKLIGKVIEYQNELEIQAKEISTT